jgi:hypothetical protein
MSRRPIKRRARGPKAEGFVEFSSELDRLAGFVADDGQISLARFIKAIAPAIVETANDLDEQCIDRERITRSLVIASGFCLATTIASTVARGGLQAKIEQLLPLLLETARREAQRYDRGELS